jgi:hypothetical protein
VTQGSDSPDPATDRDACLREEARVLVARYLEREAAREAAERKAATLRRVLRFTVLTDVAHRRAPASRDRR